MHTIEDSTLMSSERPPDELATTAKETGQSMYGGMRQTLLTGIAITVPLILTLYVFTVALDFVTSALTPFIQLLRWLGVIERIESVELVVFLIDLGIYGLVVDFLTELIVIGVLFGIVFFLGTVGRNQYGERLISAFDLVIAAIPGLGTIYKSFRRMGDVMLGEDGENFQEVKLVECFGDDVFVLGFKTSDSPPTIEDSANHGEMVSLFLPLAPNPITGGFLTYVPKEDVRDIDMTVEEGVRSVLTSGVATAPGQADSRQLGMDDVNFIDGVESLRPGSSGDGDGT